MFGRIIQPNEKCAKHKFDKEIIKEVAKYVEGNNYGGLLEVAEDWSIISLSIFCTTSAYNASVFAGVVVYFLTIIVIGTRQRGLSEIVHQATHRAAAKNDCLNWLIGTILSGYALFESLSEFTDSHVKMHHPWLGNPSKDSFYIHGYSEKNLCGLNRSSANTKKYIFFGIISPKTSWLRLKYILTNRVWNKNEDSVDRIVRSIYWIFIFYAIYANDCILYFLLFWMVPFLTTYVWISDLLELFGHFPMIDDPNVPLVDILLTKNRIWSPFVNFFFGVHWEGYHLVHHIFPKVPSWHYVKVHSILMRDPIYASLDHGEKGCVEFIKQVIQNSDASLATFVEVAKERNM